MILAVVYTCLAVLVFVYVWQKLARPTNFPPGPLGLPFVGNILSVGSKPYITTRKWKEQYGDTYGVHLGRQPLVILNDFNTIRRIFGEDIVSGRNNKSLVLDESSSLPMGWGISTSQGNLWRIHRRFALSTLRDLGMGKNWLEDTILAEVDGVCQALRDTQQAPFYPKNLLTNSVANIICALIFGQRFSLSDPKFTRLTSYIGQNFDLLKWDIVAKNLPFLMLFPNFVRNKVQKARGNVRNLRDFFRAQISEHETVLEQQADAPDYVRAYQKERENEKRPLAERETFTEKQLLVSLNDLFGAGTETTTTSILWTLVLLTENPDILRKVQEEIDEKLGHEILITTSHRVLLPYTEAVIMEMQRFSSILPLGVPHQSLEEITIDGYTIPKGTLITANFFSVHHDPRYWRNPDKFDPNNFLDENAHLIRPEGFAPFSIGKRICIGEGLARMELFLFITNILRSFTFHLPPGKTISNKDNVAGVTLAPKPFELIFIPRIN